QPDGKIVTAGSRFSNPPYPFTLARYNSNGSPDSSFGTDGIVFTSIAQDDEANSVAIQSDGKILAAGYTGDGSTKIALVRYISNGILDSSFNGDGEVITSIGFSESKALSMQIQSDGKIVLAVDADMPSGTNFVVVRYNNDGSLDSSFNNN